MEKYLFKFEGFYKEGNYKEVSEYFDELIESEKINMYEQYPETCNHDDLDLYSDHVLRFWEEYVEVVKS